MKSKLVKVIRAFALAIVAVPIMSLSSFGSLVEANTSTIVGTEGNVIYVQYSNLDYDTYWNQKAPEYTGVDADGVGYLFGGWYNKTADNVYDPIETADELNTAETSGTIVAKFVPAQTLSVKCQNWAGTKSGDNNVIVRVISAVDSTNYSGYGFEISRIADGVEKSLGTYEAKEVYSKFNYYESADDTEPDTYVPSQIFGKAADKYISCTVGYIPAEHHGTIINIKPYWVTLDGTTVYGLSKFAHVEDGYLDYVNVPVNLNILSKDNVAAAGILSVKSDDGLTFIGAEKGVEYGKVFDEMEFNVLSDGTIKCVGNTSDISEKDAMDIYINLKFQRKNTDSDAPIANEFYTFTVNGEDFCNKAEEQLKDMDVWNIIY